MCRGANGEAPPGAPAAPSDETLQALLQQSPATPADLASPIRVVGVEVPHHEGFEKLAEAVSVDADSIGL